jgi:hypothetical protein
MTFNRATACGALAVPRTALIAGCAMLVVIGGVCRAASEEAKTLSFSGRTWFIRPNGSGGPGPCNWSASNVWVDPAGQLHLKISRANGKWYCGEVYTTENLGFGQYQWDVIGRVDNFDRNIVLGLFPYSGPDGRNEIDIEMAKWGDPHVNAGSFTIWPAASGLTNSTRSFPVHLIGDQTTQRFIWRSDSVQFQMLQGYRTDTADVIASWTFTPRRPADAIPHQAMPTHINLWLYNGRAPSDGKEIEIVIKRFLYTK